MPEYYIYIGFSSAPASVGLANANLCPTKYMTHNTVALQLVFSQLQELREFDELHHSIPVKQIQQDRNLRYSVPLLRNIEQHSQPNEILIYDILTPFTHSTVHQTHHIS
jgi:hypothetical protein